MRNRKLTRILAKKAGRDSQGRISVRYQGGREKRFLREIDWKRDKDGIPAQVVAIEYDPNRSANIALLAYEDGEKRYILAPEGLKTGDKIISGKKAEIKAGNALPLKKIPVGMPIHNIELRPGKGSQIVRSAGASAQILAKEKGLATLKMPSGEQRLFPIDCLATIGQVSKPLWKTINWGKAGRKRHLGIRPSVRGTAMNPHAHPHGGGGGRTGVGMPSPKSPWGKKTRGMKTRRPKKYSDRYIIKRRQR